MKKYLLLGATFGVALLSIGNVAYAQDLQSQKPTEQASNEAIVDLIPYLQSGSSAAQLASAVAFLDDCTVPLTFEEHREASRWALTVICSEVDNSVGIVLEFRIHDTTGMYPFLEPLSFTAIP